MSNNNIVFGNRFIVIIYSKLNFKVSNIFGNKENIYIKDVYVLYVYNLRYRFKKFENIYYV